MTDGVALLTISKEDIVDGIDTFEIGDSYPEKIRQWIINQDEEVIDDCISHATRHFNLSDYYYDAICDTLEELQEKYVEEISDGEGDTE